MLFDVDSINDEVEHGGTLKCDADSFGAGVIDMLAELDEEYIYLLNELYAYDIPLNVFVDENVVSDFNEIAERIMNNGDEEAKQIITNLCNLKLLMTDIIFATKLIMDEGYKTYGNFGAEENDYSQKFSNVSEYVHKLPISKNAQIRILVLIAVRSSVNKFLEENFFATPKVDWNKGAVAVFDFKFQKAYNKEFSNALIQAKHLADEKLFEHHRAEFNKNNENVDATDIAIKNDSIKKETSK